jgi:hypothetical protein
MQPKIDGVAVGAVNRQLKLFTSKCLIPLKITLSVLFKTHFMHLQEVVERA